MEKRKDDILDGMGSINFEWVQQTSLPGAASSVQTRKQVRSHITRLQHRRARAGLQYKDRTPYSVHKLPKRALPRLNSSPVKRAAAFSETTAVGLGTSDTSSDKAHQADNKQEDEEEVARPVEDVESIFEQELLISPDSSASSSSHNEHGPPQSQSLSSYFAIANTRADPFDTYPVKYHTIHDRLLHHMLTVFAPRGWPVMNISRSQGLMWERFMTQEALVEPALFLVRLFFATGDLIRLKQLDPKVAHWLRSLAVTEINAALSDRSRYISDGLILAVGRIALAELLYGDRQAAIAMHRPAWKKMIEMRGGMKALPFPPLVKKLMRWSDSVMALKSDTRPLLDAPDEGEQTFSSEESVGVLRQWAPLDAKARAQTNAEVHRQ